MAVPPLRERREDVPELVAHFLRRYGRESVMRLEPTAVEALEAYDWPGNVRQLGRVIERAIALASSPAITLGDLPAQIGRMPRAAPAETPDQTLRSWSSRYVRAVLDRCDGDKRRACELLDISYHALQAHLAVARTLEASKGRRIGLELSS